MGCATFPYYYIKNKGIIFCCSLGLLRQKQKNAAPPFIRVD